MYDSYSPSNVEFPFIKGFMMSIEIAKAACDEFKDEIIDEGLPFALVTELTEDEELDGSPTTPIKCAEMVNEMYESERFETFDQGVVMAGNTLLAGLEETGGDPQLLKIFIENNTPHMDDL